MRVEIQVIAPSEIAVIFYVGHDHVHVVYCDIEEDKKPLAQFNSILKALYDSFIKPVKKKIAYCKRRLSFSERYVQKHMPLTEAQQVKYLTTIADCKHQLDELKNQVTNEMDKIGSFYRICNMDLVMYWRLIRDRDVLTENMANLNDQIKRYEMDQLDRLLQERQGDSSDEDE